MQQFDELYSNLTEILDKLIKSYRLLLDTVRREKDLLIEVNISELSENNKSKEVILRKLRSSENERIRITQEFAKVLKIDIEPIRLLDIAAKLDDDQKRENLMQKHSVLDLLIKRVIENNKQNEILANSALKNVTGALDAIKDAVQDKPTYGKDAVRSAAGASGQLVRREA